MNKTTIVNIALGRIGSSKQVANVDTDRSNEAVQARTFFEPAVRFTLRDFPWPFATAYADLALVSGSSTEAANNDWQYSFRLPPDCIFARRIAVEGVGRNNPNPPPFRTGRDEQGSLLFTDEPEVNLEYTTYVDDPEAFDDVFASALSWKLGADLAPALSRIKDMAKTCMQMYQIDLTKAEARALNEGQDDVPQESEFVRARE